MTYKIGAVYKCIKTFSNSYGIFNIGDIVLLLEYNNEFTNLVVLFDNKKIILEFDPWYDNPFPYYFELLDILDENR